MMSRIIGRARRGTAWRGFAAGTGLGPRLKPLVAKRDAARRSGCSLVIDEDLCSPFLARLQLLPSPPILALVPVPLGRASCGWLWVDHSMQPQGALTASAQVGPLQSAYEAAQRNAGDAGQTGLDGRADARLTILPLPRPLQPPLRTLPTPPPRPSTDWVLPRWVGRTAIVAILVSMLSVAIAGFAAARSLARLRRQLTLQVRPQHKPDRLAADVQGIPSPGSSPAWFPQSRCRPASGRFGQAEALGTGMVALRRRPGHHQRRRGRRWQRGQVTLAGPEPGPHRHRRRRGRDPRPRHPQDPGCQRAAHGAAGRLIVTPGRRCRYRDWQCPAWAAGTVTEGIVSALNRTVPGGRSSSTLTGLLQTDAAINRVTPGAAR